MDTRGAEVACTATTFSSSAVASPVALAGDDVICTASRRLTVLSQTRAALRRSGSAVLGEDHQVVTVMSRSRIDWAPACHQSKLRFKRRVVDEVARKFGLFVHTLPGDFKPCRGAVCPVDEHVVARPQVAEPIEDRTLA